jgi:multidrug efflux pump subunit AcrB
MNLPRLASDNHHFMLIIFLLLCVMGINAFFTMPRSEDPPLTLPGASIIIVYPGANPADLEELIVEPVEEAINELEDIKRIETTVKDGIVNTAVEFTFGTDAGDKFSEVVQQVNAIRNELPEDIYSLTINKWSSNDVTILQLAFVSDSAEYRLLEEKADRLKKEVERINGVRMVEIVGLPRQEIRVALNNTKMALMNISADQVAAAIQSNNLNIPGGSIRSGMISFTVKTSGSYKSLDEINNTVVGTWQGKMVFMRDVANVSFDYEDPSWIARFNGHRAVFLTVKQKENINIFSITENIQSIIEKAKQNTADGIRIFTVFDQSEGVNNRISIFLSSLLQGIILVGAIIFFSLGYRVALLVMLAVPC